MPVAGLLLWASLLTGAWPAAPSQDYLPAMPRIRLSYKGKRLPCSSLASPCPEHVVLLQRRERERLRLRCTKGRRRQTTKQARVVVTCIIWMHSRKNKKSVSEGNNNKISHIEANQNILRKHLSENFPAFLHLNSRGREPTVGMQLGLSTNH